MICLNTRVAVAGTAIWLLSASVVAAQVSPAASDGAPPVTAAQDTADSVTPQGTAAPVTPDAVGAQGVAPTDPGAAEPTAPTAPQVETSEAEPVESDDDYEEEGGEELELSAAELEALGFSAEEGEPEVDTDLKLSGFIDFGATLSLNDPDSGWDGATNLNHTSFAVGNINLYLTKNLSEDFRTMAEIRFTYMPYATVDDYTVGGGTLEYGGILVERVYLEWSPSRYLSVRAGQFLTPYGIWNVDHGSPTIIPVTMPFIIGAGFFPERQTGFEFFGQAEVGASNLIGYHLTLSNGQGPLDAYFDMDDNKAVTARLYWKHWDPGELTVGASAYYGRDTSAQINGGISDGVLKFDEEILDQRDVLSYAVDAAFKLDGWILQSEWVWTQKQLTDRGRRQTEDPYGGPDSFTPDQFSWGGYGMIGYRFDWLGVMPYFLAQYIDWVGDAGFYTNASSFIAGLNIRPIDSVALKVEGAYTHFPKEHLVSTYSYRVLQFQIAWAF